MNFKELLLQAKGGDDFAKEAIMEMYRSLLIKESLINGFLDEDFYQELQYTLIKCIYKFSI